MTPKFIATNGPHLEWNRMQMTKMFSFFYTYKSFICTVNIYLPEQLWHCTGFYRSNKITIVEAYSKRETCHPQQWMNCYVWTDQSGDDLRSIIAGIEHPRDQYFLLLMDTNSKFITGFYLCEHIPHSNRFHALFDFYDSFCNY